MPEQIAIVDYLVLAYPPYLRAAECRTCQARYFDRRNACANCGETAFSEVAVPSEGELRSFTIVHQAAAGIRTPFVAGIVDCGGTSVRGNVIHAEADPEHVRLGMKVRLVTYSLGEKDGVEAIGYGFEPAL
jgi:uncharacterized OB-fold protein